MKRIEINEFKVDNIPVITIYPNEAKKIPLIFYLHGYAREKEEAIEFGYKLAKMNFCVVSFDCWLHGERFNDTSVKKKFESVYPIDTGLDMYLTMHEVIEQTNLDIHKLIRFFETQNVVDSEKIGVTGFSMGGFATFLIAATNNRIKVAVPMGGKPSFKNAWDDVILGTSTYKEWSEAIAKLENESRKRSNYLAEIDPYNRLDSFSPKPLLIINGDRDVDQNYIYSLKLYERLKPLYKDFPERLRLFMPSVDHHLTSEIMNEATDWFKKYLNSGVSGTPNVSVQS
jgi:fermentation-respiration switch protein FrsA (DUF1100 family)